MNDTDTVNQMNLKGEHFPSFNCENNTQYANSTTSKMITKS